METKEQIIKTARCCYLCRHFREEGGGEGTCAKTGASVCFYNWCRFFGHRSQ